MRPIHQQRWTRGSGHVRCEVGVITVDDGSGRNVSSRSEVLDAIAELPEVARLLQEWTTVSGGVRATHAEGDLKQRTEAILRRMRVIP